MLNLVPMQFENNEVQGHNLHGKNQLALNLLKKKPKKTPLHFKSFVSPSPWNEFILASTPLCSVCNISSHVYANHEAYRTTIALVNICARYNNPLLPNLLLNAKCPNRSERQQKQDTFQQWCLWGKHSCVEELGRDGWSEGIQWNKHGSCFCCELPVISQLLEFDSGGTIEWLLITVVGALNEQQNSAVLTLHTNSACRQCVRSDLLRAGGRCCTVYYTFRLYFHKVKLIM